MNNISLGQLALVCHGYLSDTNIANLHVNKISYSSKDVDKNTIFIPVEGAQTSGFLYIDDAIRNGAPCILAEHLIEEIPTLVVNNLSRALKRLTQYLIHLNKKLTVIAITGSTGKTSTKSLAVSLLRKQNVKVATSEENYNTPYGITLIIVNILKSDDDILFLEFGCRFAGDIKELTKYIRCDIAILTDISNVHSGTLGDVKKIQKIKFEILNNKTQSLIANFDNPYIREVKSYKKQQLDKLQIISYGFLNQGSTMIKGEILDKAPIKMEIKDLYQKKHYISNSKLFGIGFAYSLLCTVAIFNILKIHIDTEQWNNYKAISNSRMTVKNLKNELSIIDSSYSATPPAVKAVIEVLALLKNNRKTLILGDMADIGFNKPQFLREYGKTLPLKGISDIVIINNWDLYSGILENQNLTAKVWSIYYPYKKFDELKIELIPALIKNTILIKGSNYLKMSYLVERIEALSV